MTRHEALSLRLPVLVHTWCTRHFLPLAACVLVLAAFNVGFRLDREVVTEWDESLYALSAWEAVHDGHWIGTTSFGELDYYNSKPPLNVWLIGAAFSLFGPNLVSLRIASALSAWLTIAILTFWTGRRLGALPALLTGTVLSTTFGFLYVHAGRSGNPDAPLALLLMLTMITLAAAPARPWVRVWLGPLAAGAFMLKGPAVLMPLVMIVAVEWLGRGHRHARLRHFAVAVLLFLLPTLLWAAARWQVDGTRFFASMFVNDLVAITVEALEGHQGGPFYYLNVLQKNHFEWLGASVIALLLVRPARRHLRDAWCTLRTNDMWLCVGAWAAITILVPTVMQTKLAWYLNPFYPAFALGVGWLLSWAFSKTSTTVRRRTALTIVAAVALIATEVRLMHYSYTRRDIGAHVQGLLLADESQATGRRVFRNEWNRADLFVVRMLGGRTETAGSLDDFLARSRVGDLYVSGTGITHPELNQLRANEQTALYTKQERVLTLSD